MHLDQLAAEVILTDSVMVGRIDHHPSAAGHKLVAEKLLDEVWEQ
jgi:hypothetical protein